MQTKVEIEPIKEGETPVDYMYHHLRKISLLSILNNQSEETYWKLLDIIYNMAKNYEQDKIEGA